jgi:hypothetical protein
MTDKSVGSVAHPQSSVTMTEAVTMAENGFIEELTNFELSVCQLIYLMVACAAMTEIKSWVANVGLWLI